MDLATPHSDPDGAAPAPFAEQYLAAVGAYVVTGDGAELAAAAGLGTAAAIERLSLVVLGDLHREALLLADRPGGDGPHAIAIRRAAIFHRTCLGSYERVGGDGGDADRGTGAASAGHVRQLQAVAEVSIALTASLPVDEIVELITAEACHLLGAGGARAAVELPGAPPTAIAASSGTVPEGADGADRPPRTLRASLAGRRGSIVGAIEVYGVADDAVEAEAILVQLAQVASAAIADAQLYGLEREIAETLQRSLLPQVLPRFEGLDVDARYCAAGDGMVVGGDFYDLFTTGGAALGIAIGDVCGKGPHAAALTALARYTLRAAAVWEHRPERVVALLNQAILEQHDDHRFCAALFGRLERTTDGGARFAFVTCGLPLPLVRRGDGTVEEVGSHSTVLGLVADPAIDVTAISLCPGDLMVLSTDGATEVRRGGRELFGPSDLRTLLQEVGGLSAAKAGERIEDAVLTASGGPPRDDLALVTVRIPE